LSFVDKELAVTDIEDLSDGVHLYRGFEVHLFSDQLL